MVSTALNINSAEDLPNDSQCRLNIRGMNFGGHDRITFGFPTGADAADGRSPRRNATKIKKRDRSHLHLFHVKQFNFSCDIQFARKEHERK
jgi:hypothetical protein